MTFNVPVFPDLPYGFPFKKSPVFAGIRQTSSAGRETRMSQRAYAHWAFELTFEGLRDQTLNSPIYDPLAGYQEYQKLIGTFLALGGRYGMFFFTDPSDNTRTAEYIGAGDGTTTTFIIYHSWGAGGLFGFAPVGGVNGDFPVNVYLNGGLTTAWAGYKGEDGTGAYIQFSTPPDPGIAITMDFTFYYLCFFDEDQHDYEEFFKNYYAAKSIKFTSTTPGRTYFLTGPAIPPQPPPPPPAPPPNPCGTLSTPSGGHWDTASGLSGVYQTFSMSNFVVTPFNPGGLSHFVYPNEMWKSTTSHGSGRYCFQVQASPPEILQSFAQVGISNASLPDTTTSYYLGQTLDGVGFGAPFLSSNPGMFINNSRVVHWGFISTASPSYCTVCVNLDMMRAWFETSAGVWNFSTSANPSTNTGGYDISSLHSGPYFITYCMVLSGGLGYPGFKIITGDNAGFLGSNPPSCYVAW